MPAKNGVIHAINRVLLPEAITATDTTDTTTTDTTATTDGATTETTTADTTTPTGDADGDTASLTIAEIAAQAGNFKMCIRDRATLIHMSTLVTIHQALSNTAWLFFLILGVWGLFRAIRGQSVNGNYLGAAFIGQLIFIVQAALGTALALSLIHI